MIVIEMNPRVSRSSALASKATGFPIAKIAAKLAVGYTLDELKNDITRETPASFEPTIDYCVVKVPRFTFEKFPQADPVLTTQMKSVGEAMAIGRTFKEALQKALRSLETGRFGLGADGKDQLPPTLPDGSYDREALTQKLSVPNAERIFSIRHAHDRQATPGRRNPRAHRASTRGFCTTSVSWWTRSSATGTIRRDIPLRRAKKLGFSDRQLAKLSGGGLDRGGHPLPAQSQRPAAHLSARGHLRRGVRGVHAVLLFHLRRRG